nr:hypothetical protein CFP56_59947 [Quercus suber]
MEYGRSRQISQMSKFCPNGGLSGFCLDFGETNIPFCLNFKSTLFVCIYLVSSLGGLYSISLEISQMSKFCLNGDSIFVNKLSQYHGLEYKGWQM